MEQSQPYLYLYESSGQKTFIRYLLGITEVFENKHISRIIFKFLLFKKLLRIFEEFKTASVIFKSKIPLRKKAENDTLFFVEEIMKLQKTFLVLLILFAFFQICFGQEKPKAMLVDEFPRLQCDDFLARIDNLATQLSNEPDSTGYIVTFGKKNRNLYNFGYEQLLKNALISLRRDRSRYVFVHGEDMENLAIQFWVVPAGADKPQYVEGNWSYELKLNKPFIFQKTIWEDDICPNFPNVELYSKFLLSNQNLHGNIVISEKSLRKFRQVKRELSNELVENYKVRRSRIKFFFVKEDISGLEFWLVPRKKK